MFEVTLKELRKAGACIEGYNKVVCMLNGQKFNPERETYIRFKHDAPISLVDICNNNGIDDALWALRCLTGHDRDLRLYAVWCARQVEHLMEDQRSKDALEVAERHANGNATDEELAEARAPAWAAAIVASRDEARAAAWSAAWSAVWDAYMAAAMAAARAAAWDAQKEMFITMCNGEAPWQV